MIKWIGIFFLLAIGLLLIGSRIRQNSVNEEFRNEKGMIRIKTEINNPSKYRAAQFLYGFSGICFLIGIGLAFYYDVYISPTIFN